MRYPEALWEQFENDSRFLVFFFLMFAQNKFIKIDLIKHKFSSNVFIEMTSTQLFVWILDTFAWLICSFIFFKFISLSSYPTSSLL